MRNEFKDLVEAIERHNSFFLLSHIDPDGDAVGSLIALLLLLRRRGKKAVAYDRDGVPEIYGFLKAADQITSSVPESDRFDAAIFLECPNVQRAGPECAPLVERIPLWINLDHHVENSYFGRINIVDPERCAVAEIILDLFDAVKQPVDMVVAEAIYAAIMTDTGSFRYPNTRPRAHIASARLVELGVSPYEIYQNIYENLSETAAMIAARAHATLEIHDGISSITITRAMLEETGATAEDTHDIVNFGRNIKNVEVALLFRETENGIKVSLRSKSSVDVNRIAARFGGGGHLRAAGCHIQAGMQQAKELILAAVKAALEEAENADAVATDH